jgi:His-Xaa-Ser system radical SAM maturase HxsB
LVNCAGEYIVLSSSEFEELITGKTNNISDAYINLKSKHFIADKDVELSVDMLATKMRTRKAFLKDFTSLHMVVLTGHCNCRCDYCHASSSSTPSTPSYFLPQNMTEDIADATVDTIFKSPSKDIKIEFQGGEPLINWKVLTHIVRRSKKLNDVAKKHIEFVVCTNLSLLDKERIQFLKDEGVEISTSLDGPKELHDLHRKMRDGSSAYDRFIENLEIVRKVLGGDGASPLLTVTRDHLDKLPSVIEEYIRLGFKGIFLRALNPFGFAKESFSSLGYTVEEFIDAYKSAFRFILQKNLSGEYFSENYATLLLSRILTPFSTGFMDLQSPAGAGINGAIYDYDGNVYPTDEGRMLARTGDKRFLLGNVKKNTYEEIFDGNALRKITAHSCVETLPGCSSCAYQTYCGADPVRNYVETGDIVGHRPTSEFCKKNMGIIDFLFEYILEDDERVMDVFWSWITRRPLKEVMV